jgi:hypothetical protein
MKEIASFFVSLFENLKLPAKWLVTIVTLILLATGFWGYERLSGHFYLSKLETKINLLRELQEITVIGFDSHPELEYIYNSSVDDLKNFQVTAPILQGAQTNHRSNNAGKFISGAIIWCFFLTYAVISELKKNHKLSGSTIMAIISIIVIGVFLGWVATLIPTIVSPWINYLLFPIIQIIGLIMIFKPKKKQPISG